MDSGTIKQLVGACALLVLLSACAGSEKGKDRGVGFDTLDTTSKEQKEEEHWFDSFYGEKRCTWDSVCKDEDKPGSPLGW